mgnify:CR=1 FL=1
MNKEKPIAALFDFDGVVVDTEPQYTLFWDEKGKKYHPEIPNFGHHIKGQTLIQIYKQFFREPEGLQDEITRQLLDYELTMHFEYIDGVVDFMKELRANGIKIAIVTSSNDLKMANVYKAHPELTSMVDRILTADMFTQSKPHPECFLLGAKIFDTVPDNCVVFEDSFHGLEAARRANMKIVGLCTTNPREAIKDKADVIIGDFVGFNVEQVKDLLK